MTRDSTPDSSSHATTLSYQSRTERRPWGESSMAASTRTFLTRHRLKSFVEGNAVCDRRGTATLESAGGPGDDVFPPTYAVDDGIVYGTGVRRGGGGLRWLMASLR